MIYLLDTLVVIYLSIFILLLFIYTRNITTCCKKVLLITYIVKNLPFFNNFDQFSYQPSISLNQTSYNSAHNISAPSLSNSLLKTSVLLSIHFRV